MRIAHIGNVNKIANGVGIVISNLAQAQCELGHKVLVLTAVKKVDKLDLFTEVHRTKDFEYLIDEFKPDIFIFHSLYIWEYIHFYKILHKKHIPFLLQLHGALSYNNYKKNHIKKWIANKLFYNKFIKQAKKIIYLNSKEYDDSLVKFINPNYSIIPNGCNAQVNIKYDKDSRIDKVSVLYLGRVNIHHKGLDLLIEAIKILRNNKLSDKVRFIFYGTGHEEDIKQFKDMVVDLADIAEFRGPVYGKDKDKVFRDNDIFILTSRFEGMPMGILEALSYGLPCVITPGTNMESIITENKCGWIASLTPKSIADTIIAALKEYKSNPRYWIEASKNASKIYTWQNIATTTISLYEEVLTNS